MAGKYTDTEPDVFEGLYDQTPEPAIDAVERASRSSDYEAIRGRVRVGGKNELDLDRTPIDGTPSKGPNGGIQHDTRGDASHISEDLEGLALGYRSADIYSAGFALASAQYLRSKEQWRNTPPWRREILYQERREKRANRTWWERREQSIARHRSKRFNEFVAGRAPGWEYLDSAEIDRMDGIDIRSANQLAVQWRMNLDVERMDALVVKYAAALESKTQRTMQTRFRRKPGEKQLAELVFMHDARACDVVMPGDFDKEALLNAHGDELKLELITDMTDRERRELIIDLAHDYRASGAEFPPFCYSPLLPMLEEVAGLLEVAGIDLTTPEEEEEIDWGTVR